MSTPRRRQSARLTRGEKRDPLTQRSWTRSLRSHWRSGWADGILTLVVTSRTRFRGLPERDRCRFLLLTTSRAATVGSIRLVAPTELTPTSDGFARSPMGLGIAGRS